MQDDTVTGLNGLQGLPVHNGIALWGFNHSHIRAGFVFYILIH